MGRVTRYLKHAWNAFDEPPRQFQSGQYGPMSGSPRAMRHPYRYVNDKSIIGSIYTRMALDVSSVEFIHCRLNDNDVPIEIIRDSLHECITLNPNIDQSAQALKIDAAMTMFESGHCVLVPTETTDNPLSTNAYDINSMRVGKVSGWYPRKVTIDLYDDRERDREGRLISGGVIKQITLPKDMVAIIENPFYTVMNEPSGTLQRLLRKLSILDGIDEAAGSGKLDLIFQLPYTTRSDARQKQAESRRKELYNQLKDDELGIGYIDVAERVIQLNRPIENKLMEQIEKLFKLLFDQLGLTPEIMNSTADRDTVNNYYDRTIEPIANSLALEMKRKFLTKTARTQRQSIEIYRDPFKLIPVQELPEVADKLIRNAVVTANELRPKIGYLPSKDPAADKLMNPNMPNHDQTHRGLPIPEDLKSKRIPPKKGGPDAPLRRVV